MIGIVGAGITGLTLSHLLDRAGIEHVVLEATGRVGGVIRSTRCEGRILDHGPQRTAMTPAIAGLIRELGLEGRVVRVPPGHPLFVYREGRLRRVPFTAGDLLRTDLLSTRSKTRVMMEPLTGRWREEETVGAFLTRKFGEEAYRSLLGPLFGGLYGSDPGEMYVRHSLVETMQRMGISRSILTRFLKGSFNRAAAPAAVSFEGGMSEFTAALHASVEGRVRLSTAVLAVERAEAGGWNLEVRGPEGVPERGSARVRVDRVVLTAPADAVAGMLRGVAPDAAERLGRLRYNALALVHLEAEAELEGLGYQVAYGEPLRTRGVTWNASALGRDGVYTAFLGGARDPELPGLPDEEIGEIARVEFGRVTGAEARVLGVSRTRVPSWDRSWTALEALRLPDGVELCSNYESRVGIPGRVARAQEMAVMLGAHSAMPGATPPTTTG